MGEREEIGRLGWREFNRLAGDTGVVVDELYRHNRHGTRDDDLLTHRLELEGLDPRDVSGRRGT